MRLRFALLITLLIALGATFLARAHAQEDVIETVLIQGEQELPLLIRRGLVGVLLADRFTGRRDEGIDALQERGLRPVDEGQGRIVLLEMGGEASPQELLARAIGLRGENEDILFQAGYVAEFANANGLMLITDQLIVQFRKGVDQTIAEEIAAEFGITLLYENPFMEGEYLAAIIPEAQLDTLVVSNRLNGHPQVDYAHPNLIRSKVLRLSFVPNDQFFPDQWHHLNKGQAKGMVDADIDSDLAWGITRGHEDVVIAVIDYGFDVEHPDYETNLWENPGELPNDWTDNEGNHRIDDVHGWDFTRCDNSTAPAPDCGDRDVSPLADDAEGRHGSAVAGAAAASADNHLGVAGACPDCSLMLLRSSRQLGVQSDALAFHYAREEGADIISNSWGYPYPTMNVINAINEAATTGRHGLGSVILFAMNTTGTRERWHEDCAEPGVDISELENVIAIGAVSNTDQRTPSGYGDCIDLVGPSDNRGAAGGTLWPVTTDMQDEAGYNNTGSLSGGPCPTAEPSDVRDYTLCFGGTSFATPVIAGIAGLMLTEAPSLTRLQVQQALQDTADKVDAAFAAYDPITGLSSPTTPPEPGFPIGSTHGYGRANAYEAVRLVSPSIPVGRGGTDIFIAGHQRDWGNTEQSDNVFMDKPGDYIGHYLSPSIKIDAPPFHSPPILSSSDFEKFMDEPAAPGVANQVYMRVRNRGPIAATGVTARLYWTEASTALPALPEGFWTNAPGDAIESSVWRPLAVQTVSAVPYSGSSVAGSGKDGARIATFLFDIPETDPNSPNPRHHSLFAVVESDGDPVLPASRKALVPDAITPRDNNVAQRNLHLLDTSVDQHFDLSFFVNNPFEKDIEAQIRVEAPAGWKIISDGMPLDKTVSLNAGQRELMNLEVELPQTGAEGVIEARQIVIEGKKESVLGGVAFALAPRIPLDAVVGGNMYEIVRNQQRQLDQVLKLLTAGSDPRAIELGMETISELSRTMQSQNQLLLESAR